jgi:PKHD-type hydroxylase
MDLKNKYYHFVSALTPEICSKIIDHGTSIIKKNKELGLDTSGTTFGDKHKSAIKDGKPQEDKSKQQLKKDKINDNLYVRDSEIAWLNDQWIYDLIIPYINKANLFSGWNFQIDTHEDFQFTVYNPGGFYGWHTDGGSDIHAVNKRYIHGITEQPLKANGGFPQGYAKEERLIGKVRKISLTINLNLPGEYEGGNLMFDFGQHTEGEQFYECKEIRPQGSIIIFPSFTYHCVTPITKGTRYSLVLWTLGDAFR